MFEKRRDTGQESSGSHFDAAKADAAGTQAGAASGRAAVIGPKIRINGDVSGDENLVIEGTIEGKVSLGEFRVDVGTSGQVMADIEAKVVKVDGQVRGNITGSEKVIISRSGNVRGNIIAPRMTLEDGAKFKGSIDMDPGEPARAVSAKPAKTKPGPDKPVASNGQVAPVDGGKDGLTLKSG